MPRSGTRLSHSEPAAERLSGRSVGVPGPRRILGSWQQLHHVAVCGANNLAQRALAIIRGEAVPNLLQPLRSKRASSGWKVEAVSSDANAQGAGESIRGALQVWRELEQREEEGWVRSSPTEAPFDLAGTEPDASRLSGGRELSDRSLCYGASIARSRPRRQRARPLRAGRLGSAPRSAVGRNHRELAAAEALEVRPVEREVLEERPRDCVCLIGGRRIEERRRVVKVVKAVEVGDVRARRGVLGRNGQHVLAVRTHKSWGTCSNARPSGRLRLLVVSQPDQRSSTSWKGTGRRPRFTPSQVRKRSHRSCSSVSRASSSSSSSSTSSSPSSPLPSAVPPRDG